MNRSIHIDRYSFGTIVVNGVSHSRDILIVAETIQSNWWRVTGHAVNMEDISDVLSDKPQYFIIGQGSPGLMKVTSTVKNELENRGIVLIEAPTIQAIESFNELVSKTKTVAAGFHLTC